MEQRVIDACAPCRQSWSIFTLGIGNGSLHASKIISATSPPPVRALAASSLPRESETPMHPHPAKPACCPPSHPPAHAQESDPSRCLPRRDPRPTQVGVPLGLAAELLRAGCIAASSEIVLSLVAAGVSLPSSPPSSGLAATPERGTLAEGGGGGGGAASFTVLLLLDPLRVLACALAGAAVSCCGGGGGGSVGGDAGEERGRGGVEAAVPRRLVPDPPSASSPGQALGGTAPVAPPVPASAASAGAASGVVGRAARGGHREVPEELATAGVLRSTTAAAAPAWFVPSGAFGGVFYALTAGGVFGGFTREYLLGEPRPRAWIACPPEVVIRGFGDLLARPM